MAHDLLARCLDITLDEYRTIFTDAGYWHPFVDLVCARHGIEPHRIASGAPGSFPTFIVNGTHVVKLLGPLFDGVRCWQTEIEVPAALGTDTPAIPVPEVIGAGVLSDAPDWRYIVSRYIAGEPFGQARGRLGRAEHVRLARHLGPFLRQVHESKCRDGEELRWTWDDWAAFVDAQQHGLVERHRGWGTLPDRLIEQLVDYVDDYRIEEHARPALVNADLHEDHVLGAVDADGEWEISGIIDWGDARIGDRFYELPALHLGLFHGDRTMLAAFLDAYGWPDYRTDAFVTRAMTMTLLHEFNVLERVAMPADIESLDQLADRLWRV